jgi:hypothetical protein
MQSLDKNPQSKRCYLDPYLNKAGTRLPLLARHALSVLGFSVLLVSGAGSVVAQDEEFAREVTDWTRNMVQSTLAPPATPAPVSTRTAAIVQAAAFDAVNGIERRCTPIFVRNIGPRHASKRAAAVQAAYATLIRLYPAQANMPDQQRLASLMSISRGWGAEGSDEIDRGLAWGQAVADAIWIWRSNDGFNATPPLFTSGTAPGEWRPTPPKFAPGLVPQLARVNPWVIQSPSQFRPPAPPALGSAQYATDFNETKLFGSSSSTARTPEETAYAPFLGAGQSARLLESRRYLAGS